MQSFKVHILTNRNNKSYCQVNFFFVITNHASRICLSANIANYRHSEESWGIECIDEGREKFILLIDVGGGEYEYT